MDLLDINDILTDITTINVKPKRGKKKNSISPEKELANRILELNLKEKNLNEKEKKLNDLQIILEQMLDKGFDLKFESDKLYRIFENVVEDKIYEIIDKWLLEKNIF